LFRIFDEFSQQVSIFEKHFDDDLCAYKYARLLAQENVVEIWDGGYLVAYVKLGDANQKRPACGLGVQKPGRRRPQMTQKRSNRALMICGPLECRSQSPAKRNCN
jgi:hypothetical protein